MRPLFLVIRRFFSHPLSLAFAPAALSQIALAAVIVKLVPQSPVPYTIAFSFQEGPEYFGTRVAFFAAVLVGGVIILVNWLLAWGMVQRSPKLSAVLVCGAWSVSILLWIAFFGISRFNNVF